MVSCLCRTSTRAEPEWVTIGVYQPVPVRATELLPLFEAA